MEDEIYTQNSQVIQDRWPQIWPVLAEQDIGSIPVSLRTGLCNTISIGDIQLSSRHDRHAESVHQASSIPNTDVVYIYGPGLGDLPVELLKRNSLQHLEVKIMNSAVFSLLLYLEDQAQWLNDPRVNLSFAANDADIHTPFFANPAELLLAEDRAGAIMQRLEAEISTDFVNRKFQADDPELQARIESNRSELESDGDVRELFGTCKGQRAYVIGAGPTLTQTIAPLKALLSEPKKHTVIAVDTAVPFLTEHQITPDIVVSNDRQLTTSHVNAQLPDTVKLVYQPMLSNEIVRSWKGPRYAYYTTSPIFAQMREKTPKATLFSGGSVIHPSIDLAVKLGCSEVVLLGCDFAYPLGRTHAGWKDGELGPSMKTSSSWALNGNNVRIQSDPNFNTYRCEVERYISQVKDICFFNSSREGAKITGCDFLQEFCA